MKKKTIILPSLRYENAPDVDISLRVGLDEEKSLLRNDDRDVVLDLSVQFATERANSKKYKFYGKMKMIFRNLYLGTTDYRYLKSKLFLESDGSDNCFSGYLPYDEFAFLRKDLYRESINSSTVSSLDGFTGFDVSISGGNYHQEITNSNANAFNWNTYLSYIESHDSEFPMKYTVTGDTLPPLSFVSGDGIPFRVALTSNAYVLTSPVKHGISQGNIFSLMKFPHHFTLDLSVTPFIDLRIT